MKLRMIWMLIAFCLCEAGAREFTSAEGGKKMEAEFVRYMVLDNKVTLRLASGKNLTVPATAFTADDQAYFVQQQKELDKQGALKVKVDRSSRTETTKDGKGKSSKTKNITYTFIVINESDSEFADLKLNHWVLVEKDGKEGPSMEVKQATESIASIAGEEQKSINGPTITIKDGDKGGKDKKKTSPDKVFGWKVELQDSKGQTIFVDTSSDRVERHFGE